MPRETAAGERRLALVPDAIRRLGEDFKVHVERGAGTAAGFRATTTRLRARVSSSINGSSRPRRSFASHPSPNEIAELSSGTILIGFLAPLGNPTGVELLAARGVVAFALESIPRITRAQGMDALSPRARLRATRWRCWPPDRLSRLFPLVMTAAARWHRRRC